MEKISESTQQPIILNNAVHEFKALEKRVFYVVINQLEKGFGLQQDMFNKSLEFIVPTKLLGTQNTERIKETIEGITSRKIRIFNKEDEEIHYFVPFPEIKYVKRWGHLKVRILDTAYPLLAELNQGYFKYRLKAALTLSRTYSQRFYEWFCQYKDLGEWNNVMNDYIRTRLDIDDKEYKRNSDFVKRVISDSIDEINDKTDLQISIKKYHKKGKASIGFDFKIKEKIAVDEGGKLQKIEKYYKYLNNLDPKELSATLKRLKDEYEVNDNWYDLLFQHRELLEEAVKVDALIKQKKVKAKDKVKYMNGAIKRKIEALGIK